MNLKIAGLTYEIEQRTVLKKLHLNIKTNQINAILGTNGAGKSTLLRLIGGLIDPNEGSIYFNGNIVKGPQFNLVPGHPEIAIVKQDNSLFPLHTVKENLQYVLQSLPENEQKIKVKQLSKLLDLKRTLDKVLKYLSGGEQQRVAIAAALAANPRLLLMDEPFNQTDMYLKHHLKKYLVDIVEHMNVGILFVTHDPQDALGLADQVLVLDKGRIVEKGQGKSLYYRPEKEVTATLTGYCNWLPENDFKMLNGLHRIKNMYLIRPDQVRINFSGSPISFNGRVDKVAFLGMYNLIHITLTESEKTIIATTGPEKAYRVNERISVSFSDPGLANHQAKNG